MVNQQDESAASHSSLSPSNPVENLEALVEHEDVFVERSDEIGKAVETTIQNYGMENAPARIYNNIEIAITGSEATENYTEEDWDSLGDAVLGYMHSLILMESGSIEYVVEQDPSPELQSFLINSLLDYGPAMQRINLYKLQGKDWWSHIKTDRVLNDESIKHKHTFTIDRRKEVTVDSSPHSDWVLIEHLLGELLDVFEVMYEDPNEVINVPYFDEVRKEIYIFEKLLKESDSDIDLADREDIIETVDSALEDRVDDQ